MLRSPLSIGLLLLAVSPLQADVVGVRPPHYPLSPLDPAGGLYQGAILLGAGGDQVTTIQPHLANEVAAALAGAGSDLATVPDGDGLLPLDPSPLRPVDRPGPIGPLSVTVGAARLFEEDAGPVRYAAGDSHEEGAFARGTAEVGWEPAPALLLMAGARLEGSRNRGRLVLTRGGVTLRGLGIRITAGRELRWWGPGRLHEVLLSTNARPGDGIEIGTDGTQRLPVLGPWRLAIFLTELTDPDRSTPDPLLFGHRLGWRPSPWIELGLERTIMLGGQDRTSTYTISDVWNILIGRGENREGYIGPRDTDQKVGMDAVIHLRPLLGRVGPLLGGRVFFRYAGDDAFEGLLPTRVAHHYGASLLLPRILIEGEYLETVADGAWYWNNEYPDGYTHHGRNLGSDLGGDGESVRLRITAAPTDDTGVRVELFRDSRGVRFHQGEGLRPVPGGDRTDAVELGVALTRRAGPGMRWTVEYRHRWQPDGITYDDERGHARDVVRLTLEAR